MIVCEQEHDFTMITQHDHAKLAGQLAEGWDVDWFPNTEVRRHFIYAAYQHDRGWMDLDAAPFWNDAADAPYSFRDFPFEPRFVFYKKGIDEVETHSPYSALLCSMMYSSLFEQMKEPVVQRYVKAEYQRQERLRQKLGIRTERQREEQQQMLKMLLLCDEMSLFVCMAEPGNVHDWFRDGLHYTFSRLNNRKIEITWNGIRQVYVSEPFFPQDITVLLPYKKVEKSIIQQKGILYAYHHSDWLQQSMTFTSHKDNA